MSDKRPEHKSSDTPIYESFNSSPNADLFVLTDLIWGDMPTATITGLTLLTANPLDITTAFSGNAIGLLVNNPECCTFFTTTVTYQIETTHGVPEPGTLALFGLGLTGLGYARRRKAA